MSAADRNFVSVSTKSNVAVSNAFADIATSINTLTKLICFHKCKYESTYFMAGEIHSKILYSRGANLDATRNFET